MRLLMPTLVALCLGGVTALASETPRRPATTQTDPHDAEAAPTKAAREHASPAPAAGGVEGQPAKTTAAAPGRQPTAGGQAARKPAAVSPTELALRLQKILDGQAARQQHGPGHAAAPVTRKPLPKPAQTTRPKPTPLLSWGSDPRPLGVTLAWDRDIDPRHRRPAPAGVRLTWADSRD